MFQTRYCNLFYYSQMSLVLLGMILTGSVGFVLRSGTSWQVILLVGLSTFFTYSIDNLIDWHKDRAHNEKIAPLIQSYHKLTYILIPLSGLGVIFLVKQSHHVLNIGMLLLGAAVALGTTRFSTYQSNSSNAKQTVLSFTVNRVFITFVWTSVCIFLPMWYENISPTDETWRTFIYIFNLIFTYAILWKLEKSPLEVTKRIINSELPNIVSMLLLFSMGLVIFDVITGNLPTTNLINLLPPAANLIAVKLITQNPTSLRQKISLLSMALILIIAVSVILHLAI